MNVLLINPPLKNKVTGNLPVLVEEERGFSPPLGLLYIAGYLEENSNHNIMVIDSQVEKLDYDSLRARISSANPDVVGLTTMTLTLIDVIKTVSLVKEINKDIIIVLGGPHVHLFPEETISLKGVNYLVLGEGEEAFKELLDYVDNVSQLRKIQGLVFKDNGNIINTGIRPPIKNLDKLPFPTRHLIPYKKYNSLLSKGKITTTIITSRGCPFKCTFCDRPHLGKKFRARSAKNIVDEIEECTNMGIYEYLFYDDTFTLNKERAIDVCKEIIRRKLNIGWDIRTRVDTINEELIKYLKMAGCRGIHYGVEAGTEKVLKILDKGVSVNQAMRAFNLTKKYKIPILAYFMIGNPAETRADIESTFKAMRMLKPDYVHLTILTPFPGTEIYFDGLKRGIIKEDYWKKFADNPTPDFISPHWDEIFSRDELNDLLTKGYRSFYLRPQYILNRFFSIKTFRELKKNIVAGIRMFRMK
jgi:radical SAM superfamily enzyme YgiQ (UPF0313 family)